MLLKQAPRLEKCQCAEGVYFHRWFWPLVKVVCHDANLKWQVVETKAVSVAALRQQHVGGGLTEIRVTRVEITHFRRTHQSRRSGASNVIFASRLRMGPVGGVQYFILRSQTSSPSNQLWVWQRNAPGDNGGTSAERPLRAISQPGSHRNSQSVRWLVKWPRVAPLIESAPPAAEWLPLPSSHADWITCHSSKLTSPQSWWVSMAQVYPGGVRAVHKYGNGTTFGTVSGAATAVPSRYSWGYIRNAVGTASTAGIHAKTLRLGAFEKHECLFQRSYVKTFQAWSCQVLAFLKTADALSRSPAVFTQECFANTTTAATRFSFSSDHYVQLFQRGLSK